MLNYSTIYFIYGLPGVGKSTYATKLYQDLISISNKPERYKIIHLDDYLKGDIDSLINEIYWDTSHDYIIEGVEVPRMIYDGKLLNFSNCHYIILVSSVWNCVMRKLKREYNEYKDKISKWEMIKDTPKMIKGYYDTYNHYMKEYDEFIRYIEYNMFNPQYIKTS